MAEVGQSHPPDGSGGRVLKIHDDLALSKGPGAGGRQKEVPAESPKLQDHGHPVKLRNIWLVELEG